ncbi:PEP-CTERM sorting domain-containing protein [Thalassotalea aquiviva]|uniref:PEP-CTERM sorting domain-containing protein n=1 Tax=Thalassotalea aquiviva TaxID=3242415 RepID=UPI00352AEA88
MFNKKSLIYALLPLGLSFSAISGTLIDDFALPDPADSCTATVSGSSDGMGGFNTVSCDYVDNGYTSPNNPYSILGGEREVDITILSITGDVQGPESVSVTSGPNFTKTSSSLSLSNDSGIESKVVLTWDGTVATPLLVDLTPDLGGAFAVDVLSRDGNFTGEFTLTDSSNNTETKTIPPAATVPGTTYVPFASFTTIDFSAITSLVIEVTSEQDVDLRVAFARTVPEPETIALFGLSILGLALRRKKLI